MSNAKRRHRRRYRALRHEAKRKALRWEKMALIEQEAARRMKASVGIEDNEWNRVAMLRSVVRRAFNAS